MKIYSVTKAPKVSPKISYSFPFLNKSQAPKPNFVSRKKLVKNKFRKSNSIFSLGLKFVQFSMALVLFAGLMASLQSVTTTANIYKAKEDRVPNLIIDFEQEDKNSVIQVVPVKNQPETVTTVE